MDNAATPAPKAAAPQIIPTPSAYLVESFTDPGVFYSVRLAGDRLTCTCPAYRFSTAGVCKHLVAARDHASEERAKGPVAPAVVTLTALDTDDLAADSLCEHCSADLHGDDEACMRRDERDSYPICGTCAAYERDPEARLEQLARHLEAHGHTAALAALSAMRPGIEAMTRRDQEHASEVGELQASLAKVRAQRDALNATKDSRWHSRDGEVAALNEMIAKLRNDVALISEDRAEHHLRALDLASKLEAFEERADQDLTAAHELVELTEQENARLRGEHAA